MISAVQLRRTQASWTNDVFLTVSTNREFTSRLLEIPIAVAGRPLPESDRAALRQALSNLVMANFQGDYDAYRRFRTPSGNYIIKRETAEAWNEWFKELFPATRPPGATADVDRAIWNHFHSGHPYWKAIGINTIRISVCSISELPGVIPTEFPIDTKFCVGATVGGLFLYQDVVKNILARHNNATIAKISIMADAIDPPNGPRPFFYVLALDPGSGEWLPIQLSHHSTTGFKFNPPF